MLTKSSSPDTMDPRIEQALEPVRRALLGNARREADRILAEAQESAQAMIDRSVAEGDKEVWEARLRADSGVLAHSEQAVARSLRKSHRLVLEAQEETRQQLIKVVEIAVRDMPSDPRYTDLLARLGSLARSQLGEDAVVVRCPEPDGGLVATVGTTRVDYRLNALAARALDSLAEEVVQLWS